jgi:hypothetical protein
MLGSAGAACRGRSEPADTEGTKIAEFGVSNVAQVQRASRYFPCPGSAGQVDAISEYVNVQPFGKLVPRALPTLL